MVTPPGASLTPSAALPCLRSCSAVGSLGAMRVPHYVDPTMLNVVSQLSAARAAPSILKIDPLHLQRQTLRIQESQSSFAAYFSRYHSGGKTGRGYGAGKQGRRERATSGAGAGIERRRRACRYGRRLGEGETRHTHTLLERRAAAKFLSSNMAISAVRNIGDGRIPLLSVRKGTCKTTDGRVSNHMRPGASRSLSCTHASASLSGWRHAGSSEASIWSTA